MERKDFTRCSCTCGEREGCLLSWTRENGRVDLIISSSNAAFSVSAPHSQAWFPHLHKGGAHCMRILSPFEPSIARNWMKVHMSHSRQISRYVYVHTHMYMHTFNVISGHPDSIGEHSSRTLRCGGCCHAAPWQLLGQGQIGNGAAGGNTAMEQDRSFNSPRAKVKTRASHRFISRGLLTQ